MRQNISNEDLQILCELRSNAREKLTTMSRRTKMPVSTIHERMKRWKDDFVLRYTVLLDFTKLGYPIKTKSMLKIDKSQRNEITEFLAKNRNINSVFKINNTYDLIVDACFRNMNDAENFFMDMEENYKIKKRDTYYVLQEIKREGFMTNALHIEE